MITDKIMTEEKSSLRKRADKIKDFRCKNLIVVLEDPKDPMNVGTVIRNINALGAEKLYIVDSDNLMPKHWDEFKERKSILTSSVSAVKWTFVKKFSSTEECLQHLEKKSFYLSGYFSAHQGSNQCYFARR